MLAIDIYPRQALYCNTKIGTKGAIVKVSCISLSLPSPFIYIPFGFSTAMKWNLKGSAGSKIRPDVLLVNPLPQPYKIRDQLKIYEKLHSIY